MRSTLVLNAIFMYGISAYQTDPTADYYHAAVIEYRPKGGKDGEEIFQRNGMVYVQLIEEAAKWADIVVIPEVGLHFGDTTVFIELPFGENKSAPADNPNVHPVLKSLSQAARDNKIYVAFTVHEKDDSSGESLKFNTGIVLDRNGTIVLRYRKFNLFMEKLNTTRVPEISYFDSDFGVRFGMLICFDIMFKEPMTSLLQNGVTDFLFPTYWFSFLPSALAIQVQMGWAYALDANLLAAGINSLEEGSTGTGIYEGRKGPVVYTYGERNEIQILVAKLYKKGRGGQSEGKILEPISSDIESTLNLLPLACPFCETHLLTPKLEDNSLQKIEDDFQLNQKIDKTICTGTLCCEFSINMTLIYKPIEKLNMSDSSYARNDSYYHYQYRLSIFNGEWNFDASTTVGVQECGITPCLSDTLESCSMKSGNAVPLNISSHSYGNIFLHSTQFNDISIKSISTESTDVSMPVVLESSRSENISAFGSLPDVSRLNFMTDKQFSRLQFQSDRLVFAGIHTRIYSRDNKVLTQTDNSHIIHVEL